MVFTERQIERLSPLWQRMLSHPFLLRTRDGEIGDETFATWMRQDHLFVEAAVPFVAALLARAPRRHRDTLSGVLPALQRELALFEERAASVGVDLRGAAPSFTCHAYVQFLLATGHGAPYEVAFTVLYGAEKCYHESWKVVREGLDPDSPWQPFVENWSGEEFAAWVAWLGAETDALAERAGAETREAMAGAFELTVLYEIAFWEMALAGEGWPGVEEAVQRPEPPLQPGRTPKPPAEGRGGPGGHAWRGVAPGGADRGEG